MDHVLDLVLEIDDSSGLNTEVFPFFRVKMVQMLRS
jgi:hypothetical protein